MDTTKTKELFAAGQSIWYDNISRTIIQDGTLARLIHSGAIYGVTTNPTIFAKAIPEHAYDDSIRSLQSRGVSTRGILDTLMVEDVRAAADLFRDVFEATCWRDGYVSLEVSPELARDPEGTMKDVRRLAAFVNRPNVMFKIPGTSECIPAIRQLTAEGYCINVTLLFDVVSYEPVAKAFIEGAEIFAAKNGDLRKLNSVASVFVSRIDTETDKFLDSQNAHDAYNLKGKIGIAVMREVYAKYREIFSSARFGDLMRRGARYQRVLWASTGTKNPSYSPTVYIDELVAPDTVNTVPPATLDALLKSARTKPAFCHNPGFGEIAMLHSLGLDARKVCADLQVKGVDSFMKSFGEIVSVIEAKLANIGGKPA